MNTNVEIPKTFYNILSIDHFSEVIKDIEDNGWYFDNKSTDHDKYRSWTQNRKNRPVIKKASLIVKDLLEDYFNAKDELVHIRTHYNGQTFGQHGTKHVDFGDPGFLTLVFYANPFWNIEWGGETYVLRPDGKLIINTVEPNSGIVFPSDWSHWGAAPSSLNQLRTTVAFSFVIKELYEQIKDSELFKGTVAELA